MKRLPLWARAIVMGTGGSLCLYAAATRTGISPTMARIGFVIGTLNVAYAALACIALLARWYLAADTCSPAQVPPYLDPRISPESLPTMRQLDDDGLSSRSWPIAKAAKCAGCGEPLSACSCPNPGAA